MIYYVILKRTFFDANLTLKIHLCKSKQRIFNSVRLKVYYGNIDRFPLSNILFYVATATSQESLLDTKLILYSAIKD